jgi:cellulose synthase/poly-beta-1,6-N-acetylglucosamine synthase-like glycosyltransferase
VLTYIDSIKKRKNNTKPLFISFIVPVYNDALSVKQTIESIKRSHDYFEIFVIEDRSTDTSFETLLELQKEIDFVLIQNDINKGKTRSINDMVERTKGDLLFVVDSDVILTEAAVRDILSRFAFDETIAAVSCPYTPKNKGFLATMQNIEYNGTKTMKLAQNSTSVLGLWGGCLAVKRKEFFEVGMFSENALLEDVELALKLYGAGYKVEQSSIPVETYVPDTLASWVKQKVRWSSGGTQCFLMHPKLFFKNPIQLLFNYSNLLLTGALIYFVISSISHISNVVHDLSLMTINASSLLEYMRYLWFLDSSIIFQNLFIKLGLVVFILPYSIMLIRSKNEFYKLLYAIPYAFIYSPMYTCIHFVGMIQGTRRYLALRHGGRAW